jgi:hypothetical protein
MNCNTHTNLNKLYQYTDYQWFNFFENNYISKLLSIKNIYFF